MLEYKYANLKFSSFFTFSVLLSVKYVSVYNTSITEKKTTKPKQLRT